MDNLISLNAPGAYAIPASDLDALLGLDNADAIKLYLWLVKNRSGDPSAVAAALGFSAERVSAALSLLSNAGLTGRTARRAAPTAEYEIPAAYSTTEISGMLDSDKGFKWLVDDSSRRLGRVFSTADIGVMLRIYRWLGLPCEVIGTIVTHCIDRAKSKNGDGRMPTLRQIEKEASAWADNGIVSADQADRYVKQMQQAGEKRRAVLTRLNITELTPSVERYINQWLEWGYDEEELYHALDLTVRNTGGVKLPYMNSIIKNWHEKGLSSLADIKKKDRRPSSGREPSAGPGQREKDIVRRNQNYREEG